MPTSSRGSSARAAAIRPASTRRSASTPARRSGKREVNSPNCRRAIVKRRALTPLGAPRPEWALSRAGRGIADHQILCTRTPSTGGGIVRPVRETREEAMTDLTRRTVLSAAASACALGAGAPASPAKAAAPPAGKQAPGFYRYKVGDIEVTAVTDGANVFPLPDGFVVNAKKDEVAAALAAGHRDPATVTVPYTPIVVNTGAKLVVIDTGTGEANFQRSKGAAGQFQTNLKAAGIDRNAIDTVVISHFHGDHINGLIAPDNKLAYPNAEILVPAVEWKFFMDDGEMSRAPKGRMETVFKGLRTVFDAIGR